MRRAIGGGIVAALVLSIGLIRVASQQQSLAEFYGRPGYQTPPAPKLVGETPQRVHVMETFRVQAILAIAKYALSRIQLSDDYESRRAALLAILSDPSVTIEFTAVGTKPNPLHLSAAGQTLSATNIVLNDDAFYNPRGLTTIELGPADVARTILHEYGHLWQARFKPREAANPATKEAFPRALEAALPSGPFTEANLAFVTTFLAQQTAGASSVQIDPAELRMDAGTTQTVHAAVWTANGMPVSTPPDLGWRADGPLTIVGHGATAEVTAAAGGVGHIRVSLDSGDSSMATVTVVAAADAPAGIDFRAEEAPFTAGVQRVRAARDALDERTQAAADAWSEVRVWLYGPGGHASMLQSISDGLYAGAVVCSRFNRQPVAKFADDAEKNADLVEQNLKAATGLVTECANASAIDRAELLYQKSDRTLSNIEDLSAELRDLMRRVPKQIDDVNDLDREWQAVKRAHEAAIAELPRAGDWAAYNTLIQQTAADLQTRLDRFRQVHAVQPADIIKPEAAKLQMFITSLTDRTTSTTSAPVRGARTLELDITSTMERLDSQVRDVRAEAAGAACLTDPALAADFDRLGTAKTVATLAWEQLGPAYERQRDTCKTKLAELGSTPPKPPDTGARRDRGAAPSANLPLAPAVYLMRFWDADVGPQGDIHIQLLTTPPKQEAGHFVLYEGIVLRPGMDGELSGPYHDTASLCAVLRGLSYASATFAYHERGTVDGVATDSIDCPLTGPTAAPSNVVKNGAETGGTPKPPAPVGTNAVRAARPVGFSITAVKGSAYRIAASGVRLALTTAGRVDAGTSVATGTASQVVLTTAGDTSVTLQPNTQIRVMPAPNSQGTHVELFSDEGSMTFRHPAGRRDFDDTTFGTPEGSGVANGTIYTVTRDASGTEVDVIEGSVHLTGNKNIVRVETPGGPPVGKSGPASSLDLRAGERALMMRMNLNSPPPPVLNRVDPWNDTAVQGLMDEWVNTAIPPSSTPGVVMHYSTWAQPLSQSATAIAPPQFAGTRYQYLWETRMRWTSTKLCRLGEFVERRLTSRPLTDCTGVLPVMPVTPPKTVESTTPGTKTPAQQALEDARQKVQDAERSKESPVRTPPVTPPVVVPTPPKGLPPDFSGAWTCNFSDFAAHLIDGTYRIRKDGAGYQVATPRVATGVRATLDGDKLQIVWREPDLFTVVTTLDRRGAQLVGSVHAQPNGSGTISNVTCTVATATRADPPIRSPLIDDPGKKAPPAVAPDFSGQWECPSASGSFRWTLTRTANGYRSVSTDGSMSTVTLRGTRLHVVASKGGLTIEGDLERRDNTLRWVVDAADGRPQSSIVCTLYRGK